MSTLEAHIQFLPKKEKLKGWAELSPALQSVAKVRKRSSSGNLSAQDIRVNIEKTAFDHMKREKNLKDLPK